MIILYSKSIFYIQYHAFVWVADFWCHIAGSANLDTFTAYHRWGLCLAIIRGSFTRGEIYPNLLGTRHIFYLSFQSTVQLCWTLSHLTEPTQSNTKRSVDLPTMNSHPFNAMSPCICNVCAIAYLYHDTYMMNVIWTILSNMHITNVSWAIISNRHIISLH